MSKFLTTPVWYDKNGSLIEMLTGNAIPAEGEGLLTNLSIGKGSVAGDTGSTPNYGTAVGYSAEANNYSTVLGANASAKSGIAIGFGVKVTDGGIGIGGNATGGGIGIGGDATANQIQLGSPNSRYDLKIGNNTGTINGINLFQAFASDGQTVRSASSANKIKSVKVDADSQVSDMTITRLLIGAIYVVAVRFSNASKGNIHSSFILVNTTNPSGTIFFGSGCPFLGASASVCARYISQTPDSNGAKGKIDIVQISNAAFSTYPEATMESICAFRIN